MNSANFVAFKDISDKNVMSLSEIAKIVRLARENLGLNQEDAAKRCKIGYSTYKSIENAAGSASLKAYNKVAKGLDVSFGLSIPIKKD